MATATMPRAGRGVNFSIDPALMIPLVGAGVLIYLAVLPLLMLLVGSFQMEVAPREFAYTLKNYQAAYASPYTYSTFTNSLIFASGASLLSFGFSRLFGLSATAGIDPWTTVSFGCWLSGSRGFWACWSTWLRVRRACS